MMLAGDATRSPVLGNDFDYAGNHPESQGNRLRFCGSSSRWAGSLALRGMVSEGLALGLHLMPARIGCRLKLRARGTGGAAASRARPGIPSTVNCTRKGRCTLRFQALRPS